ncbi:HAMP domain-containing protein [Faecalicatena sp. AGMB00832]|uniref:histidine kinase n=1 Tax=Faecalicatena faecalis TaxID=2726362 RepID=A0ABS6D9B3_9FIRM|nr:MULTISPECIES: HAMP domain-containing sensor histidine kinase [Faecalicatena]MBU3878184.1 HAMP domain-containing protein [Faecalicatena faecalis]MCI6467405.1 ATP-binding protein [Faecalicatena sp.]MDY5619091.1 HAMP domain-containing sensor histidine kinase [Lachnospiraceae bacterium]
MKSTLYLKFIIIYIIFGFLSFFTVGILPSQLMLDRLEQNDSQNLYQEANLIATDYLPSYFQEEASSWAVHSQLKAMKLYLNSSLWFVEADGTLITSANLDDTTAPEAIENFDPAEIGSSQYMIGDYHGYFEEDVITVMAPVTQGFYIKGYLLIHKPVSYIQAICNRMMLPIYITVIVIYILSFSILLAFHFFIYRPLRLITEAATQYASGNLTYEIPVNTHDEMGYLSASLNYMSAQLRDMEEYQKKIVANVSHDFRSPLTSIKGYIQAMADGTIPPELYGKYLNIILFETERLTDLTKDLLTLNEFDTKELLLDKTEFDIQEMIKNTAASFEGACTPKRISINLLLLPDAATVYADRRKIQQVLYNLIDNAIKFSENESTVTVEVSERGEKIFVSVKDSGIGIPRKELNKIWERFYKSDLSRGKDKKGTGLGLAIVKEAIQAHDEHINVISTEGVGTEFIFSLSRKES